MANKVLLKRSSTSGAGGIPSTSVLDYGELALNYADGKLYFKNSSNTIQSFDSSASDLLTKIKTVDGSGSGLDADLLDGQSSSYYAAKTHKDHSFVNGTYYYDQYTQDKFLRIFTENATSDTVRFGAISNVEYYDFNTSSWVTWTGGDTQIKRMLDGRQETYADIDHTHRKFRFTVTKNSGWPTQVITGIYMSWYGNGWTNIGYTLEDTADNVTFTTKETLTFGSGTTGGDYGWHLYATSNLHNGRTLQRITIDITDWTDSGAYTTKRINKIAMFSNYASSDYSMVPLKWDYDRVIKFPATPLVNNDQIWHAGNDGASSGLDADLLDGVQGSSYATLTGTQTLTNKTLDGLVLTGSITAGGNTGANGYILTSTGSGVQWSPNTAGTLDGLSDVTITAPTAQQVLKFNGSIWQNADPDTSVASAVFATNAESDLGSVTDLVIGISEDLGLVTEVAAYIYNMGSLVVDGIVSLNNIDQSIKADYIAYSIIFGF